jgi:4-hydroxy-tetrahydrodipicolinate reductase
MIKICFAGITGWTAPPILAAIDAAPDLDLVAGVARTAAGRSLADVTGLPFTGSVHGSVADALAATEVDVLIDYTSATAVATNVHAAIAAGTSVVVGSSGLTASDYDRIDRRAQARGVGVIAAGNFSLLAAVLRRAAQIAATHLKQWEIIDYAADTKPDVPSGTSRDLAETLAQIRHPAVTVPVHELTGPTQARGAGVADTRIHSVRLPSYLLSTEIIFAAAGERLTLRHDAGTDPDPYVDGTLLAVRHVGATVGVTRGLDTLLFGVGPDLPPPTTTHPTVGAGEPL